MPLSQIADRIWAGFWTGGSRIALMVAAILIVLAYLAAVRVAATGEARAGRLGVVDLGVTALFVIGAFMIASLSTVGFILDVLLLMAVLAVIHALLFAFLNRCILCGRWRVNALVLHSRCSCGAEHLPSLRRWTTEPYERHILAA
jgi:hypothetical protein